MREIAFSSRDLEGVRELDEKFAGSSMHAAWIQHFFINSYADILENLPQRAPALAIPYNCGTLLATPGGKLVGIDLALIENHYSGEDWDIPDWLYDRLIERLDLLIVSHGHWDHCWVELVERLLAEGKPVIIPKGMTTSQPKHIPSGCREVADGAREWWEGHHLSFDFSAHAYDDSRRIPLLTTRIWDGERSFLHTSDADATNAECFRWDDEFPVDVLLFKVGGLSPLVSDYEEMERSIETVIPCDLALPMHLNELGHRGTDACRPYSQAYEWLGRYARKGFLKNRRYAVLFGNRFISL